MDDETRKKIERHRVGSANVPPGVMQMVRQGATSQMVTLLLKKYDDGELDAVDFVELIRAWVQGK